MNRQIVITLPEWTEIKQIDNKQFADLLPAYDEMLNMIKNGKPLPKGHWIHLKVGRLFPSNDFKCSECGNTLDFDGVNCGRGDANYCPNCGADMRENKEV